MNLRSKFRKYTIQKIDFGLDRTGLRNRELTSIFISDSGLNGCEITVFLVMYTTKDFWAFFVPMVDYSKWGYHKKYEVMADSNKLESTSLR